MKKDRRHLEHEKLAAVAVESQAQGEFLDWLTGKGYVGIVTRKSITDLLAEYHGIDQKKLEQEKRAMLAALNP